MKRSIMLEQSQRRKTYNYLKERQSNASKYNFLRQCISNILQCLNYPTIRATCFQCHQNINKKHTTIKCKTCHRHFHSECIEKLVQDEYQMKKIMQKYLQFQCKSCLNTNKCSICCNVIVHDDFRAYFCSLCHSKVHYHCYHIPLSFFSNKNENCFEETIRDLINIICLPCINQHGIKNILQEQCFENIIYYLVKINHDSPLHMAWISKQMIDYYGWTIDEMECTIYEQVQLESIFSISVPQPLIFHSIDKIIEIVKQERYLQSFGVANSLKFLVKWKYNSTFVWQQCRNIGKYKNMIVRFLHLLAMNYIQAFNHSSHSILFAEINTCITNYIQSERLLQKLSFVKPSSQEQYIFSNKIRLQSIYQTFMSNQKQSIELAELINKKYKGQILAKIINTNYYLNKNCLPVVIFVNTNQIHWWIDELNSQVPYLSVVGLYGPRDYGDIIISKYLFKQINNQIIFKFNILITTYDYLQVLTSYFCFKKVIDNFALMVFDGIMTPLARHYYQEIKIARIKFQIPKQAFLNEVFFLKKLNKSEKIKYKNHGQAQDRNNQIFKKLQEKRIISCQQQQTNRQDQQYKLVFFQLQKCINLLNEIQRLIFLNFIMKFGLIHQPNTFYEKIIAIDEASMLQNTTRQQMIGKLNLYNLSFLSVVHKLSKKKMKFKKNLVLQIMFGIQPCDIIKRIILIQKIKCFCIQFQKNPKMKLNLQHARFQRNNEPLKQWILTYDYLICKKCLQFGLTKYQQISQSIILSQQNISYTLQDYLQKRLRLKQSSIDNFNQVIKDRIYLLSQYFMKIMK